MNEKALKTRDDFLEYQTVRMQDLIDEIVACCGDRKLYESQKFGIPFAEIKCLLLFQGERYLTVKGIAKKVEIAKSRVTKIIDGLIDKGLVEKSDDPEDARVKLIRLTALGREKSAELDAFHTEIQGKLLMHLNSDERKRVISCLELLRSAMEAAKRELV